jgi:hypothetical protein
MNAEAMLAQFDSDEKRWEDHVVIDGLSSGADPLVRGQNPCDNIPHSLRS